ncbi:MAG: phenylalanine--tRNA ligase subunit beta [Tepidiformaceae bacterium]
MKLALSWLRDFVDIETTPAEFASRITDATAEVEGWQAIGAEWDPERIRVAEVRAVNPHPNADRLRLATVETGAGEVTVVCGAPNLEVGQKVAFATEGAKLLDGHTGEAATLKLRPIRGVESAGMVLSERELGLSDDHEGILVLPASAVVGQPLSQAIGDVIFDISTWANRADLLGALGLAREVAAVYDVPLAEPATTYTESSRAIEDLVSVTIEDPDICRRFTASVIEGVTIGPSPQWMQDRLLKHGMRPINNVVDITNYVMLETGQPLHAFDYDLVRERRIVARRAKPGEKLTTLDEIERELDGEMLVICDGGGPVGIAGVMGGGNSEVSDATRNVLLEVANFKAGSIRRTSMYLKLRTEASLRFEKGLGPDMALLAQRRALHLFEQITGGVVAQGILDVYPGAEPPRTVILPDERIERVLGFHVPIADVRRVLGALGFVVHHLPPDRYSIQPPYWRPDVVLPDDVIEDLARVYGYEHLPTTSLRGSLPEPEPRPLEAAREEVRDLAAAAGYQEVITYTLGSKERLLLAVDPEDPERTNPLAVVNPVAAQYMYLRTTLRPSLLATYTSNRANVDGPLRLFEIGFEYIPVEADLPHERTVLCAVAGGARDGRWPGSPTREAIDFFDAKGAVESILSGLHAPATYEAAVVHGLLPGHTAVVKVGGETVGVIGQVHPDLAMSFGIDDTVFLFELWLEPLTGVLPDRPDYRPASRYPELRENLAFLVDEGIPAGRITSLIRQARFVSGADVFDEFRGQGVPDGKKSLTIRVRYQAPDRTLAADEVTKVHDGILKRLERELGVIPRGA